MDRSPEALSRWLRPLALLLAAEGAVSVIFAFTVQSGGTWDMVRTFLHLPHVALLIGFGVGVRILTSGGDFRAAAQRLLWVGFVAIGATELIRFQDIFVWSDTARSVLIFQGFGSVLLGAAGPGIWGTALAREADLQNPRAPAAGRAYAVMAIAGFGLHCLAESIRLVELLPSGQRRPASIAAVAFTGILLASRGSLFWSTILFWRMPEDEIASRARSRKVQALMLVWLAAGTAALILSGALGMFEPGAGRVSNALMLFWHASVHVTLTPLVTILAALSLGRPALDFEPRRKRSVLTDPLPPTASDNTPIDLP